MKKIFLLIIPALFTLSCKKGGNVPRVETITSGTKWGIKIGASHAAVYAQLQKLGPEKNFNDIAVAYKQPFFSSPAAIQNKFEFYSAITLQKNTPVIERAIISYDKDKINSIETGGALSTEVAKWPKDAPDETALHKNDPVDKIYTKLLAIYQLPAYAKYQLILPDKVLQKPFDPDMANYNEWQFYIFEDVKPGRTGRSFIRLFFKNGKLEKIRNQYDEYDVYN